jgi:hypothetical protein
VITVVVKQPALSEYVTVQVPPPIPVTTPVVGLTVAIVGQVIDHVPPGVEFVKVIVDPVHTEVGPTIGTGDVTTVTT